jgi:NhaP-type Na+/H+ or K+/H+ antiporter
MNQLDRLTAVRDEQQALYGIGLVLAAYAAASAVGGDGFLSAFAAGLAVTLLNQTLCDCFLEFGETIAEMAMLVSFVLFGAVLSSLVASAELLPSVGLAALVVFAIRPVAMSLVLFRSEMSREGRLFVGWLGPRGLASLLLSLLAVQRGVPGAELVLASVGVVVLFSSLVHGASTPLLVRWYLGQVDRRTLAEERDGSAGVLAPNDGPAETEIVTPDELAALLAGPAPPTVIDVRSRSDYLGASTRIPGSVRVLADQAAQWVEGHDRARLIVAYCT